MSYSYEDEDIESIEVINPSKSEHKSDLVSNTIYSGLSRREIKRQQNNLDKFHQWAASLGGNKDVVTETHTFDYTTRNVDYDSKGRPKKKIEQEQYPEPAKIQVSPSIDSVEERFRKAKERAGLI